MSDKRCVLIVENDSGFAESLRRLLEFKGYLAYVASTIEEAVAILNSNLVHVVITDVRLYDDADTADRSGLSFARLVATAIPKIVLTGYPDYQSIRDALAHRGRDDAPPAIGFIEKSGGPERILAELDRVFTSYVRLDIRQFPAGGALTAKEAAVYVERSAETEIVRHIQRMSYVLIIESRQQGKTSLLNYLIRHPDLHNTRIAYVDTTTLNRAAEKQWYESLCKRVLEQIQDDIRQNFNATLPTTSHEWRDFIKLIAVAYGKTDRKLVFALDEIGAVQVPDPGGFFSVIRDVYNSRQAEPAFSSVAFILAGSFHPRDLITDERISPFNIAHRVRLNDFTLAQTHSLVNAVMGPSAEATNVANQIHSWTNGQPYLTHKLCGYLSNASDSESVDRTVTLLMRNDENHLPPMIKRVSNSKDIAAYLYRLLAGERPPYYPTAVTDQEELELLGLISVDADGCCVVRNKIYEQALIAHLNMPATSTTDTLSPGRHPRQYFSDGGAQHARSDSGVDSASRGRKQTEIMSSIPLDVMSGGTAEVPQSAVIRLRDLEDSIRQDLALLKDYEDALRYEDDPRRIARYRQQAAGLRQSASRYQSEYDNLKELVGDKYANMPNIADDLHRLQVKVDMLLMGQLQLKEDLARVHQTVIAQYEEGERAIIEAVMARLDQTQLLIVNEVLGALDTNQFELADINSTLDLVSSVLLQLEQRGVAVPERERIAKVVSDATLDAKHKLKLMIPIVPLLLHYEGELTIGSNANLRAAWQRLVSRLRRA